MEATQVQINAYLNFDGQCEAAFRFYEQGLGGTLVEMTTHGDSPMAEHVPPQWQEKVLHALLKVDDQVLMGSDAPPERYQKPQAFSVSLQISDPQEAERVFEALADDGSVTMPLEKTFWAERFGMLVDRFGIPWMINCEAAT